MADSEARPHVPRAGALAAPPPESAPLAGAFPGCTAPMDRIAAERGSAMVCYGSMDPMQRETIGLTAGRRPDRNQEEHHEHHEHTLTGVRICAACDVAVWIRKGRVRGRSDIDELLDAYRLERVHG